VTNAALHWEMIRVWDIVHKLSIGGKKGLFFLHTFAVNVKQLQKYEVLEA
jgi:hypothetical protein